MTGMRGRKTFLCLGVALLAISARAADYPDRPIRIIVPFAAGTGSDVVARAIGDALSTRMGVRVRVENIVGSSGAVGTAAVAKAAGDGHTLLATTNPLTIAPHL